MAATSKSPSSCANISSGSRGTSAARGVHSPAHLPISETVHRDRSVTSCHPPTSDTIALSNVVGASSSLGADDSSVGADAQLENSEIGGAGKKPAWNTAVVGSEVGAVMGAKSWPALLGSARASRKSPLVPSNGSEEMLAVSLSPQKEPNTTISTPSDVVPSGHMSTKCGVDNPNHNRVAATDSLSQDPFMLGAVAEAQQHNAGNSGGSIREYRKEDTHRVSWQRGRPSGGNELHSPNGPLRSNSGPRADGSQHHRHGARRDAHRRENFTSQKGDGSRPFVRVPVMNVPFAPPPPPPVVMQPFFNPMFYHELQHRYIVPGPHIDPPRPIHMVQYSSMFFPPFDPNLSTMILNQIDYYFSNENLVKDTFLRRNMDSEGWVSVKLIAGFKKDSLNNVALKYISMHNVRINGGLIYCEAETVMQLTDNINLILDAIQASNVVELQGEKLRCKTDWNKWLMPHSQFSAVTSRPLHDSDQDNLAAHFNSVVLHEKAAT